MSTNNNNNNNNKNKNKKHLQSPRCRISLCVNTVFNRAMDSLTLPRRSLRVVDPVVLPWCRRVCLLLRVGYESEGRG